MWETVAHVTGIMRHRAVLGAALALMISPAVGFADTVNTKGVYYQEDFDSSFEGRLPFSENDVVWTAARGKAFGQVGTHVQVTTDPTDAQNKVLQITSSQGENTKRASVYATLPGAMAANTPQAGSISFRLYIQQLDGRHVTWLSTKAPDADLWTNQGTVMGLFNQARGGIQNLRASGGGSDGPWYNPRYALPTGQWITLKMDYELNKAANTGSYSITATDSHGQQVFQLKPVDTQQTNFRIGHLLLGVLPAADDKASRGIAFLLDDIRIVDASTPIEPE